MRPVKFLIAAGVLLAISTGSALAYERSYDPHGAAQPRDRPRDGYRQYSGGYQWSGPRYYSPYYAPRYYYPRYYAYPIYGPPLYYPYPYSVPPEVVYVDRYVEVAPPPPPREAPRSVAPPPPPRPAPAPPTPQRLERITLSATELFEFDQAALRAPQPKLDEIARAMNENPSIGNVTVTGYTDRLGTDAYNLKLSQRRADAVKRYLVGKGVAASRLTARGKGEASPVVQCSQKDRPALIKCLEPNRRVEVEQITVEKRR